ncbi:hypothetical protein M422DRAFT_249280 [Sphaerobolus stellatus SS14]|uniref:Uncharacterized protein n=1 Tax=Sphaerobolus stellatus (strain SS14) TaxID=990650 RepID=A0A0C9W5E2_SPHS4|nr:hypothetical protein M422DRAFT_249280 [Sphaerobolus stellatus SS14]
MPINHLSEWNKQLCLRGAVAWQEEPKYFGHGFISDTPRLHQLVLSPLQQLHSNCMGVTWGCAKSVARQICSNKTDKLTTFATTSANTLIAFQNGSTKTEGVMEPLFIVCGWTPFPELVTSGFDFKARPKTTNVVINKFANSGFAVHTPEITQFGWRLFEYSTSGNVVKTGA